jgi:S1-C subfamily serine protease
MFKIAAVALASALIGIGIATAVFQRWSDGGDAGSNAESPASAASTSDTAARSSGEASLSADCLSTADIYERLRPALVQITTTTGGQNPLAPQSGGSGSGIVIGSDGSILTNNHVIAGADSLEVRFADGSTASATVVGRDPGNDLALIRANLEGQELTVAPLGDSAAVRIGDPILALGNPFNLEGTLTQGIVSALDRTYSPGGNTRPIRAMIQIDAAVNPGNSGGPLINCHAEVIGVNTLLENPTGDNVNVGVAFAVPINAAKQSLPDMRAGRTVSHSWLGIAGQEITPALADDLGLSVEAGVYVTLVASGSPAEETGLRGAFDSESAANSGASVPRGGDVVVAVDGHNVESIDELAAYLDGEKQPGDTVRLQVVRDGDELALEAALAEWPA